MVTKAKTTTPKTKTKVKAKAPQTEAAMEIQMYDLTGKPTEMVPVSKEIFGHTKNNALIAQYVRVYTQNQRQGTVSAKTRSEVVGTTKKVYRQKGTGQARHGSKKAALFVGGGVTFGPKPRTFSKDLNKKQRKLALFISLSMKLKDDGIIALSGDSLAMKAKTKDIATFVKNIKLTGKKVLFVLPEMKKEGFVLSARNIQKVDMTDAKIINPYEIMNHRKIVFVGDALKTLETHFLTNHESK